MNRLIWLSLVVGVVALALVGASGLGTKADFWTFRTGFTLLRYGAYAGVGALALGAIGVIASLFASAGAQRPSIAVPLVALVLGAVSFGVPYSGMQTARSVPAIHDISTDMVNPPVFIDVLPLRVDASNSTEYEGERIAALQREAYPDVKTLVIPKPFDDVFADALEVVTASGWELVAADKPGGRIEATATTRWFGFKDDVVLRLRETTTGTAVDMRSLSRVGGSDVGANAARIRAFMQALSAK